MSTKTKLLSLLNENKEKLISGQMLADTLGISRNAVWKAVKSLQEQGFAIESVQGTGYRLAENRDIISVDFLSEAITVPCTVHLLDSVDSTNNYAKKLDTTQGAQLVIAREQTSGRGRLGRSFYSPADKGIYMSLAFSPEFGMEQSLFVTTLSAVAVCHAIEDMTGRQPKIKWVNDIYLNNKKLVGILTEAESNFENGNIEKIIVGIGINCFETEMPEELADIATRLASANMHAAKPSFDRNHLIASAVNHFFAMLQDFDTRKILRDYKQRSFLLGEQILIYNPAIAREMGREPEKLHDGIRARAIDIDDNGGLVIEFLEGRFSGQMRTLTTGEVTVRKL